jgi:hypothetical protein
VIATSANAHRHAAAPAAIQPVALLPLLHPTPPQHWTAPGRTGLNDVRKIAPTGIAPLEARGFLIGFPGLLCLGVTASLSGNGPCAAEPRNPRPRKHRAELLPPMAAHCASSTSETPSEKPKKSQIRLLGPWWSNRVYPQNHAVFSPRSQLSLQKKWSGRWESNIRYIYEKIYKTRGFCSNAASSAIEVRIFPSRGQRTAT